MKDLHDIVRAWRACREIALGQGLALATLVRATGSSYRRPGARLLIFPDGRTIGSLSGGCLEDEIAEHAATVLAEGRPRLYHFDTTLRYGCHGSIDVLVEPLDATFADALMQRMDTRRLCVAGTFFPENGERVAMPAGSRVMIEGELCSTEAFLQEVRPAFRLVLFGNGPDSAALCIQSRSLGWEVVEAGHLDELAGLADEWTAFVVKSHNYGRDFAALRELLPLPLRYVGLVGSRRRRDELLAELLERSEPIAAELYAPAGLQLGGETPEEIALSIVAEIQSVFGGGNGASLRSLKTAIHLHSPEKQAAA